MNMFGSVLHDLPILLARQGLTLSTAESCTGGLVAHWMTEIPGSSEWYKGGIVAYANEWKSGLLGVDTDLLDRVGAVSAEVAEAMARNAAARFQTDLAISTTGIAGPGGGSAEKPVGLVYIGRHGFGQTTVRREVWTFDRSGNKEASAQLAIEMIVDLLRSKFPS